MTALASALAYADRGWPVFPCRPDKRPLVKDWPHAASRDPAQIEAWWQEWPGALIGCPTGLSNTFVVLDIDIKDPSRYGFDTLAELGFAILPDAPMTHTASGGLHLYFQCPAEGLRNTAGSRGRGIGAGVDWRGIGGYVILPSQASGYRWDPCCNFDTMPLAAVPPALLPREPERPAVVRPTRPPTGLSAYAEAALDSACRRIIAAPNGEQRDTVNAEAFAIGTLTGAGAIPRDFAYRALLWAAAQMPSYDPLRPWRTREIEDKVRQAFEDGCRHPREGRHGRTRLG